LSKVGVISVCAATLYMSMMAVYYANVITAESELRQEVDRHLVTALKMRRAMENAERANERKAVFLAKMSHQLRTPLNAIIGYSEILLEEGDLREDRQTADLKMINSAGRHLLALLSDVLHMPRIESDDFELSIHNVEMKTVLEDVALTCRSLVTANGNEFIVDVPDWLGSIESDETRLRQIIINLLSNAGKFTSGGTVILQAQRQMGERGDEIAISVQDTGIGMSAQQVGKLFVEFNQAGAAISRAYGGTGLGLAVSRKLCQLLCGTITVESEERKGSTFLVRIPVKVPVDSLAAAA
jgi:signal transduction histidine kinase